jgi:hypothetical protein
VKKHDDIPEVMSSITHACKLCDWMKMAFTCIWPSLQSMACWVDKKLETPHQGSALPFFLWKGFFSSSCLNWKRTEIWFYEETPTS